jgi:hypothetical protein
VGIVLLSETKKYITINIRAMKTTYKTLCIVALVIANVVVIENNAIAQSIVEGPNQGISTIVVANKYSTWNNAANALRNDKKYASVSLGTGEISDIIEVGNFGFHIPSDAVIEGITVTIKKGANTDGVRDNSIQLIKNGVVCEDNHAGMDYWPQSPAIFSYGDESDLWSTNWSAADINSYAFGVAISIANASYMSDSAMGAIDYVSVTVKYRPHSITVKSFGAVLVNGKANINWTAITPNSNSIFVIERSEDGIETNPIGTVNETMGDQLMSYSFVDSLPLAGTSYYRLMEVNSDGETQNFEWAAIMVIDKISGMSLYPNPSRSSITIDFPASTNQSILMIMDESGRVVMNETLPASNNEMTTYVKDISELPSGVYVLLVNEDGKNYTKKFIRG